MLAGKKDQKLPRVLIASPVRQKPCILKEFLGSLKELETTGLEVAYVFIDDNDEESLLLKEFARERDNVRILRGEGTGPYYCDENTHYWREDLIWKVAEYKNRFLEMAREEGFDYLFLVDSDLVLHPKTLTHLVSLGKDIVSEVFWTRWRKELEPLPQVWAGDAYRLYPVQRGEILSPGERKKRQEDFLRMLRTPGVYRVGGLGACTLISRRALLQGVSFSEIYNLSFPGEDRHFCIRAAALGLELYADTHYPAYHIYRESDLAGVQAYKEKQHGQITNYSTRGSRITLAMLVRNEAGRYLERVLRQAAQYIHNAVILDDASTDNTVEVCQKILEGIPLTIVSNPQPGFHNEVALRKQLWELAVSTQPDWILILDADEIFEDKAVYELPRLAADSEIEVYYFRLYDMWDKDHYREDSYWQAHLSFRPFMVRYIPGFPYVWKETPLHCGRFPVNISELKGATSRLRVKHLGWMNPADRQAKFQRYMALDPEGKYGIKEQYLSILDPQPNLKPWIEETEEIEDSKTCWERIWAFGVQESWDLLSETIYQDLLRECGCLAGKRILEAGSGTGRISLRLASEGAQVILVDYSPTALQHARRAFEKHGQVAEFVLADIRQLPLPDEVVDITWNAGVLEHLSFPEQLKAVEEMKRVTKPGGLIITFNPYARCLPYRLGKYAAEKSGIWPYGPEHPVDSLAFICHEAKLELVHEYSSGFPVALDFLDFIPGSRPFKELLRSLYEDLPVEEKKLFPGYLLVSVMRKPLSG